MSRVYRAIVCGKLISGGTIDQPVGRHASARIKMAVYKTPVTSSTAKPAITHFRIEQRFAQHTELRINLETGRTHQIRVHLAHVGAPVLGDIVYGDVSANDRAAKAPLSVARPLLHAWRLGFDHPFTKKRVEVVAPPPPDLARAVRQVSG